MYRWYQASKECYVFLDDVEGSERMLTDGTVGYEAAPQSFRASRWFTRGWTLQELLAPSAVYFYDGNAHLIASRSEHYGTISGATGIPSDYLLGKKNLWEASIAQRMSWAAKRQTTRLEDRAYSLLGIFDVNLPLLYGEGTKAFLRLQLAVILQSDDETIFAWGIDRHETSQFGILAQSPANFIGSESVVSTPDAASNVTEPTQVTNKGISYSYVSSVGELRSSAQFSYGLRPDFKQIRLPCAIGDHCNENVGITLTIKPATGSLRGIFTRVGVTKHRGSIASLVRLLDTVLMRKEKVHIAYTQHFETREGSVGLGETRKRSKMDTVGKYVRQGFLMFCILGSLAIFLVFFCALSYGLIWNVVLVFGILISLRDLARISPFLIYSIDLLTLLAGGILQSSEFRLRSST